MSVCRVNVRKKTRRIIGVHFFEGVCVKNQSPFLGGGIFWGKVVLVSSVVSRFSFHLVFPDIFPFYRRVLPDCGVTNLARYHCGCGSVVNILVNFVSFDISDESVEK